MVFLTRRWSLLLITAATTLVLFVTVRSRILSETFFSALPTSYSRPGSCPSAPPDRPLSFRPDGFDWSKVHVKHPAEIKYRLPEGLVEELPRIQHNFSTNVITATNQQRREAVKRAFVRAWDFYGSQAWTRDEVKPVTGQWEDTFGGWGATLVDSLDTLWIMGLHREFIEAVTAISSISFGPDRVSLEYVNMFETTIRYLGGFLAAYDLTDCKDERLLRKAVEVGDMIFASYDTPNRMPVTRWAIRNHQLKQLAADDGIIAELASASLEFTRLSQLTGDMKYYDAITRITNLLNDNQNKTRLPGMFPTDIKTRAQNFSLGTNFGFGAMADSAYEYFGKTWQLLGGRENVYQNLYEAAMDSASSHLLFRPSLPDHADVLVAGTWHDEFNGRYSKYMMSDNRDSRFEHLSCFAGGMYLLGGQLFGNDSHTEIGQKLTHGCIWAYKNSPLGIMPEIVDLKPCPTWDECPYHEAQISPFINIPDPSYNLRPEAIESVFYAYRITGEPVYQDIAWKMWEAVEKHTKTRYGNAAIKNVMVNASEIEHLDSTESFWFSETLKYFYLIFSEPDLVSLDEFVYNTEAHPFRIQRG